MCTASGQASLLTDDRFTSKFYTQNMLVENGSLTGKMFLGMRFIVIPDYQRNGQIFGLPKTGNIRSSFAYHKEAIGMGIGIDQRTMVDWIPEKTSWLVNTIFSANATAIDPIGIVQIDTDESA